MEPDDVNEKYLQRREMNIFVEFNSINVVEEKKFNFCVRLRWFLASFPVFLFVSFFLSLFLFVPFKPIKLNAAEAITGF